MREYKENKVGCQQSSVHLDGVRKHFSLFSHAMSHIPLIFRDLDFPHVARSVAVASTYSKDNYSI